MTKKTDHKTILVVDDDPDMRIFFSTLLITSGFKPIVAKTGNEGIQKAREKYPCFIILDVPMPGNGGMDMYHNLKLDQTLKNIPVIMTSTLDQKTFNHYRKVKGTRYNQDIKHPDAFLEKPPEAAELIKLIKDILSHKLETMKHKKRR